LAVWLLWIRTRNLLSHSQILGVLEPSARIRNHVPISNSRPRQYITFCIHFMLLAYAVDYTHMLLTVVRPINWLLRNFRARQARTK
jgi:hypothetical protein